MKNDQLCNAKSSLLSNINSPGDIKNFSFRELIRLAAEIRGLIIGTVASNGGHLASNLGTVELSIALHRIFNSPDDKIVWDVATCSAISLIPCPS